MRFRSVTSVFVDPEAKEVPRLMAELHTGALHLNRATVSVSMRLPTLARGRASNGVPAGIELLRNLTAPRSMLVGGRNADDSRMLPGVRWDATPDTTASLEEGEPTSP